MNTEYNKYALLFGAKMRTYNNYPHEISNSPLSELFTKTMIGLSKEAILAFNFIDNLKKIDTSLTPGRILRRDTNNRDMFRPVIINTTSKYLPESSNCFSFIAIRLKEGAIAFDSTGSFWSHTPPQKHKSSFESIDMYYTGGLASFFKKFSTSNNSVSEAYEFFMKNFRKALAEELDNMISGSLRRYWGESGFMDNYIDFAQSQNPSPKFIYPTFDTPPKTAIAEKKHLQCLPPIETKEYLHQNKKVSGTTNTPIQDSLKNNSLYEKTYTQDTVSDLVKIKSDLKLSNHKIELKPQSDPRTLTIKYNGVRVGILSKLKSGNYNINLGTTKESQITILNPPKWKKELLACGFNDTTIARNTYRENIRIRGIDKVSDLQSRVLLNLIQEIASIRMS